MINVRLCGIIRPRSKTDAPGGAHVRLFADSGVLAFRNDMVWLTKMETRFLAAVISIPDHRQKSGLLDMMWSDDKEGGPLDTQSYVSVICQHTRWKMRRIGVDLRKTSGRQSWWEVVEVIQ